MSKRKSPWIWVVVALVAVAAGGFWFYRTRLSAPKPQPVASKPATPVKPAPPPIRHPISAAQTPATASTTAAPIDGSDPAIRAGLDALTGKQGLDHLLVSHDLIQHVVATIDALPRRTVNPNLLPVHSPRGAFITAKANGKTVISDRNAARYASYMKVVEAVDPATAVHWYVRHYPLFQSAYQQLGYPKAYFNDRLVQVIDLLLATPDAKPPLALQRPNVFYTFDNPDLESLSAGQKMLLRAGPADEARIKAKLRAIRSALTGQPLPGKAETTHR